MRINITINDETIMDDIQCVIDEMELEFTSEEERDEFAADCLDDIASKIECYENYFPSHDAIYDTVEDLNSERE